MLNGIRDTMMDAPESKCYYCSGRTSSRVGKRSNKLFGESLLLGQLVFGLFVSGEAPESGSVPAGLSYVIIKKPRNSTVRRY